MKRKYGIVLGQMFNFGEVTRTITKVFTGIESLEMAATIKNRIYNHYYQFVKR
jgi:hypothetical protein